MLLDLLFHHQYVFQFSGDGARRGHVPLREKPRRPRDEEFALLITAIL